MWIDIVYIYEYSKTAAEGKTRKTTMNFANGLNENRTHKHKHMEKNQNGKSD